LINNGKIVYAFTKTDMTKAQAEEYLDGVRNIEGGQDEISINNR
jgi:hypothetical protein